MDKRSIVLARTKQVDLEAGQVKGLDGLHSFIRHETGPAEGVVVIYEGGESTLKPGRWVELDEVVGGWQIQNLAATKQRVILEVGAGSRFGNDATEITGDVGVVNGATSLVVTPDNGAEHDSAGQVILAATTKTLMLTNRTGYREAILQNVGAHTIQLGGYRFNGLASEPHFDLVPGQPYTHRSYRAIYAWDPVGGGILNRHEFY